MALNSKVQVPMPSNGIIIRSSGKYHYVYKVLKTFRNDKGQPSNIRTTIGRLDKSTGMLIPNDTYYEHYSDATVETFPAFDSVRSVGATFLVGQVLKKLKITKILTDILGQAKARSVLTAAIYMVCRGNIFARIMDWCEGYTLCETALSTQMASSLFASITYDERMAFFKSWIAIQALTQYLAYDVTSLSSYAKGIEDTEWGYNRDGEKLAQINMGCYLGEESGLPMFYVTYPGSIVDKSHMPYMMAYNNELEIHNVSFVMDKGFCSTANLRYMHDSRTSFIMSVEMRHKATRKVIDKVREGIVSMRNRLNNVYALCIRSRFYGVNSIMHIYYDPSLAEQQRSDLQRTVENMEGKLKQLAQMTERDIKRYSSFFNIKRNVDGTLSFCRNYDKIDTAARNNGFFCLLTNKTITSTEVLKVYRRKDVIEKGFDDLKNHIDMKRMHTHTGTTTDGKLFCAFIALIAASEMTKKLLTLNRRKTMSKADVISELEKIKVIQTLDGKRLMNPITKTQRAIFEAFDLKENDLKAYVNIT
jgi:transposase